MPTRYLNEDAEAEVGCICAESKEAVQAGARDLGISVQMAFKTLRQGGSRDPRSFTPPLNPQHPTVSIV